MRSIEIRRAAPAEYPAVAALRVEMAREMGSHDFESVTDDWRGRFVEYFAAKHRSGEGELLLAYDGEAAIGSAIVYILDDYRRAVLGIRTAYVHAVYVRPEFRRRGVAKGLMQHAIAWARESQCRRIRLRSSDQGRPLYESLNFRPTSEMELDL